MFGNNISLSLALHSAESSILSLYKAAIGEITLYGSVPNGTLFPTKCITFDQSPMGRIHVWETAHSHHISDSTGELVVE